jgi:septum formation protein
MNNTIVLASASPRRKKILATLGLKFRVIPAKIREVLGQRFSVKALKELAVRKALKIKKSKDCLVIGADTVVVVKGKIFGKPRDIRSAKKMLAEISGKDQEVWTALAIFETTSGKVITGTSKSIIRMKGLSPGDISYLANKNLDKAGGYGIQEDDQYLKMVSGSYTNVVGFPVELRFGNLQLGNLKKLKSVV